MRRRHVTPLRRIEPPLDPWSSLIDGSMYAAWQQATDTSESADPSPEDGYEVDAAGTYTGENECN